MGNHVEELPCAGGDLGGDVRAGRVTLQELNREADGHFRRGDVWMRRTGKKAAGRLLDGRTWDEMPAPVNLPRGSLQTGGFDPREDDDG